MKISQKTQKKNKIRKLLKNRNIHGPIKENSIFGISANVKSIPEPIK